MKRINFENGNIEASAETMNTLQDNIEEAIKALYPIGSVYVNLSNNANPAILLGFGTWQRIKDRFIYALGDSGTVGSTGGEATHVLTVEEMPSHNHSSTTVTYNENGSSTMGNGAYKYDLQYSTTTGSKGGGKAHNNMPPYIMAYMWKRTA